jgi:hypothetical protein
VPSGEWYLRVHGPGFGVAKVVLGPRVLAPGEVWECGEIVVREDGD